MILSSLARRAIRRVLRDRRYHKWFERFYGIGEPERNRIREQIAGMAAPPKFSVIMPTYNSDVRWLALAVASVRRQLYPDWELCIADDCSTRQETRDYLARLKSCADPRVQIVFRSQNGHISAASNSALEIATGQFIVLLDHDDELLENSLYAVAKVLDDYPDTDLVYSDEDKIDHRGRVFDPYFKPDWNRDLFYSQNCISHLGAYRASIVKTIGGFRQGLEGSQDYDLALRFIEQSDDKKIRHIPEVLYHWRAIPGSVALRSDQKSYAHDRARTALQDHHRRTGTSAEVVRGYREFHRTRYTLPFQPIRVSLIGRVGAVPAAAPGSKMAMQSESHNAISICESVNSPEEASGDVLLFLDDRCDGLSADSIAELCSHALRPRIGVVGCRIASWGVVQSAGAILGLAGTGVVWGGAYRGYFRRESGMMGRAQLTQNYSVVDSRCFAIGRKTFQSLGGLDPGYTDPRLGAADLCLRAVKAGFRNVWTPYAEADCGFESRAFSGSPAAVPPDEEGRFRSTWRDLIAHDPAYNPNLTLSRPDFSLAERPRCARL